MVPARSFTIASPVMRTTVDSNIFVYIYDARDPLKQQIARDLVADLRGRDCILALQAVGEVYSALSRRLKLAPWQAAQAARNLMTNFRTFASTRSSVEQALAEAMAGRFSYRDALLLACAHEAGCDYCFSEDMADGARLGGIEIINPFGASGLSERAAEALGR